MSNASFLPEDYLVQKHERRTNIMCLALFAIVMSGVAGAFLVTNRQSTQLKVQQQMVNAQYQQAALKIDELKQLQAQKSQMLDKAELASALVERVPRSILLAELINRMPGRLSLLQFVMTSEKIKSEREAEQDKADKGKKQETATNRLGGGAPQRAKTKDEAAQDVKKIEPPRFRVAITMVGVAPTDLEVSRYLAELNNYQLLQDVTLEYSLEKTVEGQLMREFRIKLALDPDADVRDIEPLAKPRAVKNPMSDRVQFTPADPNAGPVSNTGGH